ncbi:MAG: poly-gamma-glutamate system protein [Ignavibacteriales bacterium]|nr:poly-gamma-glutamate system protein [Ignavibacteriales bacterium]
MPNKILYITAITACIFLGFKDMLFIETVPLKHVNEMRQAERLSEKWKSIIQNNKTRLKLETGNGYSVQKNNADGNNSIIGEEYTPVTSTLGSLESKELSNNTLFSALIVRLVNEAGVDSAKTIGIIASGSFPALTLQTLAALQTMHKKIYMISSLGSSSYGANQPGALWIDMEAWLRNSGGCMYHSAMITYGAEGDTAGGLPYEGKVAMDSSLSRNRRTAFIPENAEHSLTVKYDSLIHKNLGLLINIGGNQSALGYCSHAELIPNGLHAEKVTCSHIGKGLLSKISEKGIPFIHLLNLKNLAAQYSITEKQSTENHPLYCTTRIIKWRVVIAIAITALLLFLHFRMKNPRAVE